MPLRLWIDRQQRPHGFEFREFGQTKAAEMLALRRKVGKEAYPMQLVRDLLVAVYPIELAWSDLSSCFTGKKRHSDFAVAVTAVEALFMPYRGRVLATTDSLLAQGVTTADIPFSRLIDRARKAQSGDNGHVEDLEYSYVNFSARFPLFVHWGALGLMGRDKDSAYGELVDFLFDDETRRLSSRQMLENYVDASMCFGMSIAGSMGGGPGFPPGYQKLPPLW